MLNFTLTFSLDDCKTKERSLFDVFAKDIPITKQEIVLQKTNVVITTGYNKLLKYVNFIFKKKSSAPCHQEQL